jgi:hypothetical protein
VPSHTYFYVMKVWHFSPYSIEKNFGKAINEYCALVPAGDWIAITDGDVCKLLPDWGKHISDIAFEAEQQSYHLLGCMTNRLRQNYQLVPGMFEERDISYHYKIAHALHDLSYYEIERIKAPIAGFFMLFPQWVWDKHRFQEGTECFDTIFSNKILRMNGKIGLAKGLYLFHAYRTWSDDPKTDTKHLFK